MFHYNLQKLINNPQEVRRKVTQLINFIKKVHVRTSHYTALNIFLSRKKDTEYLEIPASCLGDLRFETRAVRPRYIDRIFWFIYHSFCLNSWIITQVTLEPFPWPPFSLII